MKLLRFISAAVIVSACASYVAAQKPPCSNKQAPEFHGFQLGMHLMEVKDALADSTLFDSKISDASKIGTQGIRIPGSDLKDENAEGIDDVNLTFMDKRVSVIRATFHGGTWMGAKDFFKQISDKLQVPQPSDAVTNRPGRGGEKYEVECTGFSVVLAYSFGVSPNVTIFDNAAHKLVEERREKNPDGEVKDIRITPGRPPVTRRPE